MMNFTTPISIHFLIHDEYEYLEEVCKFLYKTLCRDSADITFDGLDIPVYFHIGSEKNDTFPGIDAVQSDIRVIVPLVDDAMFCDQMWEKYINGLKNNYSGTIYPIVLSDYAFDFDEELSKRQFIRLKSNSILENKIEFSIRFFEILNRLLQNNENNKLKLFISHSKKDKDNIGEKIAQGLRDYINSQTKLSTFFDANDILDGLDFEETILKNVGTSFFVLIHSATYSNREWCRKEILECKAKGVPAIRVDAFSSKCDRVFPYMANIPSIRFADNWDEIVALMLRTALDWKYQQEYLRNLCVNYGIKDSAVEPTVPELLSIHKRHRNDEMVLYPEPPIGLEELDVLVSSFENKKFVTPMQMLTKDINLIEKKIAISISEPSNSEKNLLGAAALRDLAIELARHLLAAKAQLVYGGDLRPNGFTEQLAELSYQYFKDLHDKIEVPSFHNFLAWPLYNNIGKREQILLKKNRVKSYNMPAPKTVSELERNAYIAPDTLKHKLRWAESLTMMRMQMEDFADAVIVIGGRTSGFKGFLPGIIEEAAIAMQKNKPIYIIGAAGGCGRILSDVILHNIKPKEAVERYQVDSEIMERLKTQGKESMGVDFFDELYSKGLSSFDNGLRNEANIRLMNSSNLTEIVALILEGIKNKRVYILSCTNSSVSFLVCSGASLSSVESSDALICISNLCSKEFASRASWSV